MNLSYHNIESRNEFPGGPYRVGYAKSTGQAVRIYRAVKGWRVFGHEFATLAAVSAHLNTL